MLFSLAVRRDAGLKLLLLRWYDVLVKQPLRRALRAWQLNLETAAARATGAEWAQLLDKWRCRASLVECVRAWQRGVATRQRARAFVAKAERTFVRAPKLAALRKWKGYGRELSTRLRAFARVKGQLGGLGRWAFVKWYTMVIGGKRMIRKADARVGEQG